MLEEMDIIKLDYVYELIAAIEDGVDSSYEILSNGEYDELVKYQMALSFFNVAETNYVNYLYIVREIGVERDETYSFEKGYKEFKHQLFDYVLKKDTNTSWLSSKKSTFLKKSDVLKQFISEVSRSYYEAKRMKD